MTKAVVEEAESGDEHRRERELVAQAVRRAFQVEVGVLAWGGVQQGVGKHGVGWDSRYA